MELDDERLQEALRTLAERREHRVELCPRCVKRERDCPCDRCQGEDLCRECCREQKDLSHEREKARKRRWWHRVGKHRRRERRRKERQEDTDE